MLVVISFQPEDGRQCYTVDREGDIGRRWRWVKVGRDKKKKKSEMRKQVKCRYCAFVDGKEKQIKRNKHGTTSSVWCVRLRQEKKKIYFGFKILIYIVDSESEKH